MNKPYFDPKDYVGTTPSGARLYVPKDPRKREQGLLDIDYSSHKVWGLPVYSKRTGWLIIIVLYGLIGIPYTINIIDKVLSTYFGGTS